MLCTALHRTTVVCDRVCICEGWHHSALSLHASHPRTLSWLLSDGRWATRRKISVRCRAAARHAASSARLDTVVQPHARAAGLSAMLAGCQVAAERLSLSKTGLTQLRQSLTSAPHPPPALLFQTDCAHCIAEAKASLATPQPSLAPARHKAPPNSLVAVPLCCCVATTAGAFCSLTR